MNGCADVILRLFSFVHKCPLALNWCAFLCMACIPNIVGRHVTRPEKTPTLFLAWPQGLFKGTLMLMYFSFSCIKNTHSLHLGGRTTKLNKDNSTDNANIIIKQEQYTAPRRP